jgi:quercetin dioxygenase-like cupin family protein
LSAKKSHLRIGNNKGIIKIIGMIDQGKKADSSELEKSKAHIIVEIIEYMTNSVVIKTIIRKSTGNISVMSFDSGEGLTEKTSPFDTFVQIIEGKAEIVIDKETNLLESGQGIIIPAHSPNFIKPNGRFKMISTIIKSGYE